MRPLPPVLAQALRHPVAILGWGASGQAAAVLVRRLGGVCRLFDEQGMHGTQAHFGAKEAKVCKLVLYSPGFPPEHPWLQLAQAAECLCLGETDFASTLWPGGLIAVTGSNGKTSLTLFLTHALNQAGIRAVAAGNIGTPLSAVLMQHHGHDTLAVCEISSFQAENLHYLQPCATLWTNFYENHLERHGTLEAYFAAKWNLVRRLRRPRLVIGETVAQAAHNYSLQLPAYACVGRRGQPAPPTGSLWDCYPQHENYALAHAYWHAEGLPPAAFDQAAHSFTLPAYRLQYVGTHQGVAYWNDAKSTTFASTLAALKAFSKPVLWIGGGKSKGGDIPNFARQVASCVQSAYLLGETAPALAQHMGRTQAGVYPNLQAALAAATAQAQPGSVVLLSPGFSSLDMFSSYAERGRLFDQWVHGLTGV